MTRRSVTFLGIFSLFALSCITEGELRPSELTESSVAAPISTHTVGSDGSGGPGGHGGSCASRCSDDLDLVGTWDVMNYGVGKTGRVTFNADNTYTIDSGTYNAGGTWLSATWGTYKTLPGGAIAFTYGANTRVNRIAAVQCATRDRIVHFVLAHSHDYEELVRARP